MGSRIGLVLVVASGMLVLALASVVSAAKPPKPPAGLSAFASVAPTVQYLGDSTGTTFALTIRNAGTLPIGAVEIARPGTSWLVLTCPQAPAGWVTQRSDNFCRYRSAAGTADDLQPATSSSAFQVVASTLPGTADRTGTWTVTVSASNGFDSPSALKPAPAEPPGLAIKVFSFEITDVLVAAGTPGAPCPAPTTDNHAAVTGSTQVVIVCGRNRMTVAATPTAGQSSLGGTFIADDGTFSSAAIPAGSGNVVVARWDGAQITSTSGPGKSIVTRVGSHSTRTSPLTTLDDACGPAAAFELCIPNGGYEALNEPPDAADDTADADEDGPAVPIDVLGNDTDPDGDPISVTATGGSPLGMVTITGGGTGVDYDPNGAFESLSAGETGTDVFTYTIQDSFGATDTATVTVTITGANDGPNAVDDPATVGEDASGSTIDVLGNDTDADASDTLAVSAVDTTGTTGTVTNNGTDVSYDPNGQFESLAPGETATDSFTYTASDGNGGTDTATVTVTITGANDGPNAVDDGGAGFTTTEDTAIFVTGNVLANDTDSDASDVLAVSAFDDTGTIGIVDNVGNGTFTYEPNGQFGSLAAGETATDTFTYTVSDGNGGTDTATVTITITGVNDPPTAVDDTDSTSEFDDVDIDVLANDTDPDDSDVLAVTAVDTTGTTGLVSNNGTNVNYDPNGQFDTLEDGQTDTDTFTYTVSDGNGGTDTATVTVTIIGVTDLPPTAVDDDATVAEDPGATAIDVLANDMNSDGGPMTISSASDPANGTVVLTGGSPGDHTGLTYEPDPNYCNDPPGTTTDTFTYTLNGGSTATVSVVVTCVNDLPVATDDTGSTDEDTTLNVAAPGVLANDTDADGPSLSVTQLNGSSAAIGVATAIPSGALVTLNANGSYVYNPNGTFADLGTGEAASDTFSYTVSDGAATDTATVTITIDGINDDPDAVDDTGAGFTTDEDTSFTTASVLGNDSDPDGDTLTIPAFDVTGMTGLLTYNDDGTFDYDPNGQFNVLGAGDTGTDTFTYTISDGHGGFDTATVTITITGVNDPPTANDDTDTTDEDTTKVVNVLANDTDPDLDTLVVSIVGTPGNGGTVSITNAGANVTFNPGSDFQDLQTGQSRNTSFTYTASDGNGGTDTATATITVTGVSDAPVADDETFNGANSAVGNTSLVVNDPTDAAPSVTGAKKSITGDILDGDTDVDGPGPLTVTAGTFATVDGGSVTIEADGDFVYLPNDGGSCTDTSDAFTYTVEDSGSPELTDTGTVNIGLAGCVWYVDNAAAAGGDGRSSLPFDTLEEADVAATTTGATIYVFRGNGTATGLTTTVDLLAGQRLHGEAIDLVVDSVSLFTGAGGQRPSLAGNILLAAGNHLSGFAIAGSASPAVAGGAGDAGGTIADVVVTGSAGGLHLSGTSGTWTLSDLSVSTSGGEAMAMSSAGTVTFTSAGTISATSAVGAGVRITGTTTSGVIDSVTVTSSPNEGIVLDDNPGALTINDINLTTTGTGLLVDSSNDVTISGGDADITSGGAAVSLTTVTSNPANPPDVTLDQVTSSGGSVGIFIDDIGAGTFSAVGGSLSGHSLAEVDINAGSGNVTYGGTIGNGTGLSVEVSNRTGGTVSLSGNINDTSDAGGGISLTGNTGGTTTFSGATKTLSTGALTAVSLSSNTGHTINLNGGGLDIDTTIGTGFSATNGGLIQVTTGANPNTIDTSAATAVNVNSTSISSAGMTFRSVNSNGGTNGIVLTSTGTGGTNGSFAITGNTAGTCGTAANEADCSGGTLQAKTGDAISLNSTLAPSFTRVNVKNNLGSGIRAVGVSGLTVSNSRIVDNADTAGIEEAGISLNNVTGTTTITSSTVRDSFEDNIEWNGSSGTGTITVSSSTVGPTDALGNSGIQMTGIGTAALTLNVTGSTFPNNNAMGIGTSMANSSALTMNVSTSTFTGNNMAVAVGVVDDADITFDINGNTALHSETNAFQVLSGETSNTGSHVSGFIRNNIVGDATADSGARDLHGIAVELNDDADGVISILNNTIQHVDQHGIFVTTRDLTGTDPTPNDATLDVHIRDNAILSIDDNSAVPIGLVYGMLIDARSVSNMCLDINSNDSFNIGAQDIRVRQRDTSIFRLERFVGNGLLVTDVEAFIVAQNDPGTTADATVATSYTGVADGTCRDP